jgi:hypothetical protein
VRKSDNIKAEENANEGWKDSNDEEKETYVQYR